jgi:hypothetical protein
MIRPDGHVALSCDAVESEKNMNYLVDTMKTQLVTGEL